MYNICIVLIADEYVEDDDCELFDDGEAESEEDTSKAGPAGSSDEEDSNVTSNQKTSSRRQKDLRDMMVTSSKGAPKPAKRLRFVCCQFCLLKSITTTSKVHSLICSSLFVGGASGKSWSLCYPFEFTRPPALQVLKSILSADCPRRSLRLLGRRLVKGFSNPEQTLWSNQ